jgi:transposase
MVWGAIWIGGRSDIVIMQPDEDAPRGGYTTRSYLKVLQDQIPRCWQPGHYFMQDNASIHTSSLVLDWLKDHGIRLLPWPPYSPDLNPIEAIWAILKKRLNEEYPDLHKLGRGQEGHDALAQAIIDIWNSIPQEIIDRTIEGCIQRIRAVYKAKGWHTQY